MIDQSELIKQIPGRGNSSGEWIPLNDEWREVYRLLKCYVYEQPILKVFKTKIDCFYRLKEIKKQARIDAKKAKKEFKKDHSGYFK